MGQTLMLAASDGSNAPIVPHDFNEVIWGTISIALVVILIVWKGGPAIGAMWRGRIERIEGELDTAANQRSAAEATLASIEARIADAEAERQRIRADAEQNAVALREQIAARAAADASDVRTRGLADIAAAREQVSVDLGSELADLTVGAAEVVVARNLDPEVQADLIERYIASLGDELAQSHGEVRS